jgi:hypothetical protein
MALLFSFSIGMDMFVISRVVTANRLTVDSVCDQPRSQDVPPPSECAIGPSYRVAKISTSVSHIATSLSSEEALVAPIDTKVSIDTIVQ